MTWLLVAFIWWAIGVAAVLFLAQGNHLTWRDLGACALLGLAGPMWWLLIGLIAVCRN